MYCAVAAKEYMQKVNIGLQEQAGSDSGKNAETYVDLLQVLPCAAVLHLIICRNG